MAKGLNFRSFAQPTLPITMNDSAETLFTLTAPSVELAERLEANQDTIIATFQKGDRESLDEIWALAASLISCNRECRQVTAEELKGRYGMSYYMLFAFLQAYGEFIEEIESAKN
jgi:hypothetical protein